MKRVPTNSAPYEEAVVLLRRMRELQATLDSREHKYTESERRLALSHEQLIKRFANVPIDHGHSRKTIRCLREDVSTLSELSHVLRQESEACARENVRLKEENKTFTEENNQLKMQIRAIEQGKDIEMSLLDVFKSDRSRPTSSDKDAARGSDASLPLKGK